MPEVIVNKSIVQKSHRYISGIVYIEKVLMYLRLHRGVAQVKCHQLRTSICLQLELRLYFFHLYRLLAQAL